MRLYLWKRIDRCSGNYHTRGGVVVLADSLEEAKELFELKAKYNEYGDCTDCHIREDELPNLVVDLADDVDKEVYIFPDAGCC